MKSKSNLPIGVQLCLFLLTWFAISIVFEIISQVWISQASKEVGGIASLAPRTVSRFMQFIGTLVSTWLFTKYIDKVSLVSIGFQLKNRGKDIIFGIGLGFAVMAIAYFVLLSLNEIALVSISVHAKGIIYSMIFFILVSLIEEILCRGYVLGLLLTKLNKYVALMISAVIFTALHSFNPNMGTIPILNLFLAGILLGITYIYTKNLWFPIALHFSWNFFQGPIFGFEVSGQEFYSVIQQSRMEDNLLNGGSFGFEGSLLATSLLLVSIFVIDQYYRRKIGVLKS
ncbi:CPBP family intramembrane glutamic endopeptidase [Kordia jejudonensis]|uniref:CPBP family intramembrane glutamic endopeptidase n=1 Tax=Kordia jejudonensis TaxID=1348245 RepID=UPI00069CB6D2|nr:CPBP family intramembrane glutamic endopeptidase [Kordia jejudonensis]